MSFQYTMYLECPGRTRERSTSVCGIPGLGGLMQLGDGVKLIICMVGISGSGKSYFNYYSFV